MSWVALGVIGGWLVAAAIARNQYVENLRESIHQHRLDAERQVGPLMERATSDLLASKLQGNPAEVLYALSLFEATHAGVTHPAVRALLRHESPEVRARAVSFLAAVGDLAVKDDVERLLRDEHLDVRTEALLYLTRNGTVDPVEKITALGDFPDFSIRAALVAFLARPGKGQNLDAARLIMAAMAEEQGPDGVRVRLEAARLLARLPDAFERELRTLLEDDDPDVARAAVKAVGELRKRPFLNRLLERLDEPWLVNDIVEALAKFGDRIVGTLRDYLVDGSAPLAIRREIPLVLQAIGTPAAQYVLNESVLDADTVIRYRIITALNKLGQQHPERRVDRKVVETVLAAEVMGHYRSYQMLATLGASLASGEGVVEALRDSMQHEAERIFRLLKIMYPEHDLHSAYVGMRSTDPVVHDNALEFLENILAPQVREIVLPLFDRDVTPEQRADLATERMGAPLGTREETVELMAASGDAWLMSCAAYAIGEMRLTHLAHLLDGWLEHQDPLLRTTALDARDKLKQNAGGPAAA
jgi:AAA family ATP:ADP antiporter